MPKREYKRLNKQKQRKRKKRFYKRKEIPQTQTERKEPKKDLKKVE